MRQDGGFQIRGSWRISVDSPLCVKEGRYKTFAIPQSKLTDGGYTIAVPCKSSCVEVFQVTWTLVVPNFPPFANSSRASIYF